MWDERYSSAEYVYGTRANDFLATVVGRIPLGPVLELGAGEGRNAVFLAEKGYDVTAVDQSAVGLDKAQRLAAERGVQIMTVQTDLVELAIEPKAWAGIVSVFCHVPRAVRAPLHASAVAGLQPGGVFILEAYTPSQLGRGTGGPPVPDLMMTLQELMPELNGVQDWEVARETTRAIHEGRFHNGLGDVVQIVARKGR